MSTSWSIKGLFNLVLAVLLVPSVVLLATSIVRNHHEKIEAIHSQSLSLAKSTAEEAIVLLDDAKYILRNFQERPLVRSFDPNRCDPIIRDVRQWHSEYGNLSTIAPSGQVICNASSRPGQKLPNYGEREWFGRVLKNRSFTIGFPVIGGTTKIWVSPLVQPVFDSTENMIGVISMTVNLARFKPKFIRQEFPSGTEVAIVDSDGVYVANSTDSPAETWLGRQFPETALASLAFENKTSEAKTIDYQGIDGNAYVAAFLQVPETHWHVIVTIPTRAVAASARNVALFYAVAFALVLAMATATAALVLRFIRKSISSVTETAVAHTHNHITARAAEAGPNEIVDLAKQFNLMLEARDRSEARIAYLAHYDLLTGLANRALFLEKAEKANARWRMDGTNFTIMLLDLDRFKDVNDTLGHSVGDLLLAAVAQRVKALLNDTDILARLGGDEFGIIRSGEAGQSTNVAEFAARIVDTLAQPFDLNGLKVSVGTSIGIAQAPADSIDHNDLLKKADLALYRQKFEGRNGYLFYISSMQMMMDARHQTANDLREALSNGHLDVHYQAIFDVKTRKPSSVEALIRWQHPQRGSIAPQEFIPLAEEYGLIGPIGEFVLRKVCKDAAAWPAHIKVAINLSPVQLKSGNLTEIVQNALADSGLSPSRLEIEITESVLIENFEKVQPLIQSLKALGITLALDDFGTGYSSLNYLTMFPFDKIKIDKSFTGNVIDRQECAAIVASVVALSRSLGISTTAEGVETEMQLEFLRAAGVTFAQGYLLARPCPVSQLDLEGRPQKKSHIRAA